MVIDLGASCTANTKWKVVLSLRRLRDRTTYTCLFFKGHQWEDFGCLEFLGTTLKLDSYMGKKTRLCCLLGISFIFLELYLPLLRWHGYDYCIGIWAFLLECRNLRSHLFCRVQAQRALGIPSGSLHTSLWAVRLLLPQFLVLQLNSKISAGLGTSNSLIAISGILVHKLPEVASLGRREYAM